MDLSKFIRMLQTSALYFANAKELEDVYEGCLSRPSLEHFAELIDWKQLPGQDSSKILAQLIPMIGNQAAVNCWHMSEHENVMMWSKYASALGSGGVAIQSTSDRLCASFTIPASVWVGQVRYIDYYHESIDPTDVLQWFLCKRLPFAPEQELRAVVYSRGGSRDLSAIRFPSRDQFLDVVCPSSSLQSCPYPTVILSFEYEFHQQARPVQQGDVHRRL